MTQRLRTLFSSSHELRQLAINAKQLIALQNLVEQALPASLRRASHVMRLEKQTLVIAAHHGAAAAKIRQMAPVLQKHLHENGYEVTLIQVLVQVSELPRAPRSSQHVLGAAGKQQLSRFADTLPDSPLKQALRGLVERSRG
ncbi:MAG TPA: DciA family protein [Gallionellaceae bacterium]